MTERRAGRIRRPNSKRLREDSLGARGSGLSNRSHDTGIRRGLRCGEKSSAGRAGSAETFDRDQDSIDGIEKSRAFLDARFDRLFSIARRSFGTRRQLSAHGQKAGFRRTGGLTRKARGHRPFRSYLGRHSVGPPAERFGISHRMSCRVMGGLAPMNPGAIEVRLRTWPVISPNLTQYHWRAQA